MAKREPPHWDDTGFVTVFARTPQLCAGAFGGLGSALWLNVVGPFAGLVSAWGALGLVNALAVVAVAVLAMLVTAAGSLVAADWQADVASCQAWAEIDIAVAELCLPAETAAPSLTDPCYVAIESEGLRRVFRAHRFSSLNAGARSPMVAPATRISVEPGRPLSPVAASAVMPRVARKVKTAAASDGSTALPAYRNIASAFLCRGPAAAAARSAQPQMRAESAVSAVRLVANSGAWSEWFDCRRRVLTRPPPDGHIGDLVVLSGNRGDRDQRALPGPSTGDGTVKRAEPPSCRGSPPAIGQRAHPSRTVPVTRSAKESFKVPAVGALRPVDLIVRDNLGHQVPVCAAELDVIETYLDQVLRDLLAPGGAHQDGQMS